MKIMKEKKRTKKTKRERKKRRGRGSALCFCKFENQPIGWT